jgi:hypothetical protein
MSGCFGSNDKLDSGDINNQGDSVHGSSVGHFCTIAGAIG